MKRTNVGADGLMTHEWEEVQKKTFTRWCAKHLKERRVEFNDILEDFKDGVKLIQLLEIIGKHTFPRWHKAPRNHFQKLENLDLALGYITKEKGIKLIGIDNENIMAGKQKPTLGLTWSCISKFVIEEISVEEMTARDALLIWCKKNTAGYDGVEMKNFTRSWVNGLAWCALINKFRPNLLDYSALDTTSTDKNVWLENTKTAFAVLKDLGIECLMDPEDCVGPLDDPGYAPDDKAVVTQVSELYHYFAADSKQQVMADKVKRAIQLQKQIEDFKNTYEEDARATVQAIEAADAMLTAQDYEKTVLGVKAKLVRVIQYARDERPEVVEKRAKALRTWASLVTKCKTTGRVVPPIEPGLEPETLTERFTALDQTSETRRTELTEELKQAEQALIDAFDTKCQEIIDAITEIKNNADALDCSLEDKLFTIEGMLQDAVGYEAKADALAEPNAELVSLALNTRAKYTMFNVQTEVDQAITHLKHLIEQTKGAQFEAANQARIAAYNAVAGPLLDEANNFSASVSEVQGTLVERRTALLEKQTELDVKREAAQVLVPMFQELEKDGIHLDIANTPGKINGIYGGILNKIVEDLHKIYDEMVTNFDAHTTEVIEKCKAVSKKADDATGEPTEVRDIYAAALVEGEQIEPEIAPLTPEFDELVTYHLNFKAKYIVSDVQSEYEGMIAHIKHLLQSKETEIALNAKNSRIENYNTQALIYLNKSHDLEKEIEEVSGHEGELEARRNEMEQMREKVVNFDASIEELVPVYADLEKDQIHLDIEHTPASIKAFTKNLEAHAVTLIQELDQAIAAAKGLEISEEQLAEFRETFTYFDKDGNALLEPFQLEACLTALGEPIKDGECKEIIDKYTNGQEGMDFDNYVRFMLDRFSKVETADSTKEAFLALSQDKAAVNDEQIDRWFEPADAAYLKEQLPQTEEGYEFVPWVDKIYA